MTRQWTQAGARAGVRARSWRSRISAVTTRFPARLILATLFLSGLASVPRAAAQATAVTPPSDAARGAAVSAFEADERLGKRLLQAPGDVTEKARYLFDLAYDPAEPDLELKSAALRRLRTTDPRIVATVVTSRLAVSSPEERIGMLEMSREIYGRLGGLDATLDDALAERIRDQDPKVAGKAIEVLSELGVAAAYLPLREVAGAPGSPLREQAVAAIARLHDPRAVVFFGKLLGSESAPKEQIYHGLAVIGRPSALLLKEKLSAPHAQDRDLACDALITMANGDDLSALYVYIQKYPPEGERKQRIYDAIATIEARGQDRPAGAGN